MIWTWVLACTREQASDAMDAADPGGPGEEAVGDVPSPSDGHTGEETGEPEDGERILYGDDVVELRIEIDEAAYEALERDPEEDVPVRVRWEDETWEDVGLHLKGSWSFRDLDGKASFKM